MEAHEKELMFLGNEGKVIIPFFQRTYVWDEENWENLLEGLFQKPVGHFLGSIILKQLNSASGEPKKLEVVDGQQRLTTLSILIKALYDTFSEQLQNNTINVVRQILFSKITPTSGEYYVKIEHSQIDREAYERVIKANIDGPPIDIETIDKNSHKIFRCYKYFYELLKDKKDEERKTLFDKLLETRNKMLVVIDLKEDIDDEQTIFDTLNTAGVRLTTAEIIKNALYQQVIKVFGDPKAALDLYKDTWEKTFLTDEDTVRYWETERLTGRLKRDNVEILLHCIGVIKGFYDPDKHTLSELSKLYKEEIKNKNSRNELINFTKEIVEYGNIYRERMLAFDSSTALSFEDSTARLLHILDVLQISTFYPFILHQFKIQENEAEIVKILSNLEKFVVNNMLAKNTTEIKNYNKLCKEFIRDTSKLENKLRDLVNIKNAVSNGLRGISNKEASLILFWIELYRRNKDPKRSLKELKYVYSLEHIMPQKWEEYWRDIPKKYKADGSEMTDEEARMDRNDKINWIGNMTLLTSSLNAALRNYDFERKMKGHGRKKGIISYAELSITNDDIVIPFQNGDKVWDEFKIIARTKKLEEEVNQIWGIT